MSSQPSLLAHEGPTAATVCAPARRIPRQRAAWAETCFPLLFPFSTGFSHLPNGLYPSYIPLSHLEPPSAGSPLLAQLGQHSLFESQKGESGSYAFPLGHPWVLTLISWLELLDAGMLRNPPEEQEPCGVIIQGHSLVLAAPRS